MDGTAVLVLVLVAERAFVWETEFHLIYRTCLLFVTILFFCFVFCFPDYVLNGDLFIMYLLCIHYL